MDTVVRPALAAGDFVITDRHIASTLALQQVDGIDIEVLWHLNVDVLRPDLSVFLGAPADLLEGRLNERGRTSRFERTHGISAAESRHFAEAAELMTREGFKILRLSTADADVESVAAQIDAAIEAAE
jgi:thymidylate kinase